MKAIPVIPPEIDTLERLDLWIDAEAPKAAGNLAARLRMIVAVMDRAVEIGAQNRAPGPAA